MIRKDRTEIKKTSGIQVDKKRERGREGPLSIDSVLRNETWLGSSLSLGEWIRFWTDPFQTEKEIPG